MADTVKKANWFKRTGAAIAKWFRGMKSELKKVVWPSWSQVLNNTLVVIVVSVVIGVVVWLFDFGAISGINALMSLVD